MEKNKDTEFNGLLMLILLMAVSFPLNLPKDKEDAKKLLHNDMQKEYEKEGMIYGESERQLNEKIIDILYDAKQNTNNLPNYLKNEKEGNNA